MLYYATYIVCTYIFNGTKRYNYIHARRSSCRKGIGPQGWQINFINDHTHQLPLSDVLCASPENYIYIQLVTPYLDYASNGVA